MRKSSRTGRTCFRRWSGFGGERLRSAARGRRSSTKRARRAVRRRRLPGRRRGLFPRHGWRRPADPGRGQGPRHVAGVDRRRRPAVGQADQSDLRLVRSAEDRCPPIPASNTAATTAGSISGWSTSRAFASRPDPTRSITGYGSTSATPTARPIRSPTRRNIRAWRSARAARTCRWARITASRPASSGCGCSPIPAFDEAAAKRWDAQRYYNDPGYYLSKDLVRPYRVGMSCGFCHVSANPDKPPANPDAPQWENLSSTVGAQYFWVDRILAWNADPSNFMFQVLHTSRPGIARHLAGLDRQHQQPAHDECDLQSACRGWSWPGAGAARRWGPTISTTSSSTISSPAGR